MEVYIDAVTVRLTVDGQRVEQRTDYGTARLLDVGSARLYVGGVGVAGRAAAVDARLDSLLGPGRVAAGSLRGGCVQNFKVDLTCTSSSSTFLLVDYHRRRRHRQHLYRKLSKRNLYADR